MPDQAPPPTAFISLPPELERELDAIRKDVADAGVTLWLDESYGLHAWPAGKLAPSLVARLKEQKPRIVIELLVLETYAWRQRAWTAAERARITAETDDDLRERIAERVEETMAAVVAGDLEAAKVATDRLRTAWRATARRVYDGDEGDRLPPDDFPRNKPKEKTKDG